MKDSNKKWLGVGASVLMLTGSLSSFAADPRPKELATENTRTSKPTASLADGDPSNQPPGVDASKEGPKEAPKRPAQSAVAGGGAWNAVGWAVDGGNVWIWRCGAGPWGTPSCSNATELRVPKQCFIRAERLVNCNTLPRWNIYTSC